MQKQGVQGKYKIGDMWENSPYAFQKQHMPDILVYVVQKENPNRELRFYNGICWYHLIGF